MGLIAHAERELKLAGLFDPDSDYNGMLGKAVMDLVKVFAKQGHSGFSAGQVREIFHIVSDFKTLTPTTSDPGEWMQVSPDMSPKGEDTFWQNTRRPSTFSRDGGKTWYDLDDESLNHGDTRLGLNPKP